MADPQPSPVSREEADLGDTLATLVELAREQRGKLIISSSLDGSYRVALDYPNGCASTGRSLRDAATNALKLAREEPLRHWHDANGKVIQPLSDEEQGANVDAWIDAEARKPRWSSSSPTDVSRS